MEKVWDVQKAKAIDRPEELDAFLKAIEEVCKKHNFSISHEDPHGSFVIHRYNEQDMQWLLNANKDYEIAERSVPWGEIRKKILRPEDLAVADQVKQMMRDGIDPGELTPSVHGFACDYNGENPGYECRCDGCDFSEICFRKDLEK